MPNDDIQANSRSDAMASSTAPSLERGAEVEPEQYSCPACLQPLTGNEVLFLLENSNQFGCLDCQDRRRYLMSVRRLPLIILLKRKRKVLVFV